MRPRPRPSPVRRCRRRVIRDSWAAAERSLRALCRQVGAPRALELFRQVSHGPIEAAAARARTGRPLQSDGGA